MTGTRRDRQVPDIARSIVARASPWRWCPAAAILALLFTLAPASAQSSAPNAGPEHSASRDAAASRDERRRILFLYGEPHQLPAVAGVDQTMRSILRARLPVAPFIYTEFLDINLFDGAVPQRELRDLLRRKYETRALDLIVAAGSSALRIAVHNRADLFSNAPIVFVSVDRAAAADVALGPDVTGTWLYQGWAETLDLARRLQHETRQAVVVTGSSRVERVWARAASAQLGGSTGQVAIRYLTDLTVEDLGKEVVALTKGTVVLLGGFVRDAAGRDFTTREVSKQLATIASVPYVLSETCIGTGAVGGHVVSFEAHGRLAADLALRVLAGERPPPISSGTTIPMFDERQLKRWGIDRRLVPAGSDVRFHEPSLWEHYRGYVIVAVALLLVQSGLIAALLVQHTQRRRTQRNLAERLAFETLLSDLSRAFASCSDAAIDSEVDNGLGRIAEDLGADRVALWSPDDRTGVGRITHSWTRPGIHPQAAVVNEGQFPSIFSRIRQGGVLWLPSPDGPFAGIPTNRESLPTWSTAIAPLIEGGKVVGVLSLGMVLEDSRWPEDLVPRLLLLADIFASVLSRQRAAQAADENARDIRDLAGRLMTAEEDERRRIARELHDGVNQDVAALAIALTRLEDGLAEATPADRRREVARLQMRTIELAEAIRHLSHELHPGILEYTGLAAAMRSHCREFEREQGLTVTCEAGDDLGTVPGDVALCLYRVTQEALTNAARHAKASHIRVAVTRDGAEVVLTIRDDGIGFDLAEVRGRMGLGLLSLGERVRLVGGRLAIETEPWRGTRIRVAVPLDQRDAAVPVRSG